MLRNVNQITKELAFVLNKRTYRSGNLVNDLERWVTLAILDGMYCIISKVVKLIAKNPQGNGNRK